DDVLVRRVYVHDGDLVATAERKADAVRSGEFPGQLGTAAQSQLHVTAYGRNLVDLAVALDEAHRKRRYAALGIFRLPCVECPFCGLRSRRISTMLHCLFLLSARTLLKRPGLLFSIWCRVWRPRGLASARAHFVMRVSSRVGGEANRA